MKKQLLIILCLFTLLFTGCMNSYEQLTLYKRKILRTNLMTQNFDTYNRDTTVSQLLSAEVRGNNYNFNEETNLIYDTAFLNTPSTLTYSFDKDGKISSIDFDFFFGSQNTEQQIEDIYAECIKFFGYPDEGYTRKIYEYLHKSPSVLWIKNNALISLEFYLDDNLNPLGKMRYFRTEWNGSDMSTFKLPFTINALGDRIDTVVGSESKKMSLEYNTSIGYSYRKDNFEWFKTKYIFKEQFLAEIELDFFAHDLNEKQMQTLINDIKKLMQNEFKTAEVVDTSNKNKVEIAFKGEATSITLFVDKSRNNREINVIIEFDEYYN